MNEKKEFEDFIARVKRTGAGLYDTEHFMCLKHEHWKFLWAADRIAELEAENRRLREQSDTAKHIQKVAELEAELEIMSRNGQELYKLREAAQAHLKAGRIASMDWADCQSGYVTHEQLELDKANDSLAALLTQEGE